MVIQEESNNKSLLSKPDSSVTLEEANTLINAYDSRKFVDHGKTHNSFGGSHNSKKDNRICTFCNRSGHTIDVCYRKHGFPQTFSKKQTSTNASNASHGDTQSVVNNM